MNGREKSDPATVAVKPTNDAERRTDRRAAEEPVERRAGAEGNASQHSTHRTQNRARVTQALERVRQAARRGKQERFTALLHHVNVDTLRLAFYALKRKAAAGADGASSSGTRGGSRMRESRTYGSVRGARGNPRPYRDPELRDPELRHPGSISQADRWTPARATLGRGDDF